MTADQIADTIVDAVTELWCQALGLDAVDPEDDFFDLGGSSITAIRMIPLITDRFGVEPDVTVVFDNPTPRKLAAALVSEGAQCE